MQQLKETISILQTSNEDLREKLLEKERLLEKLRNNFEFEEEGESFEICEEETSYKEKFSSSHSSGYSSSADLRLHQKRSHSDIGYQVSLII